MTPPPFPRLTVNSSSMMTGSHVDAPVNEETAQRLITSAVQSPYLDRALIELTSAEEKHAPDVVNHPDITSDATLDTDSVEESVFDYGSVPTRTLIHESIRARFIAFAQQRERRSAWELVFIMLAGAVAVLLSAPPLVQILLAAHGIEA